jgi:multidrug efflux pump subunit AcrA (membrane-fusion protein)
MTEQTKTRFPAPLYAAAGAGDLAYRQLRKLPAVVNQISERAAASLRTANEQAGTKASELREKAQSADYAALRGNAASVATTFAQVAQDRAVAAYTSLVARGERVVGSGVVDAADVVNADLTTTEAPTAVETAESAQAIEAAKEIHEAPATPKPRKRAGKPAAE